MDPKMNEEPDETFGTFWGKLISVLIGIALVIAMFGFGAWML